MVYKIVVWGLGSDFKDLFPLIKEQIDKGIVEVVGAVDERVSRCEHFVETIRPMALGTLHYDYLLITSSKYYDDIYSSAILLGVDKERIVNGTILKEKDFDFCLYVDNSWINDNLFGDYIRDVTYEDRERVYRRKNLTVTLGRKSYIGLMRFKDWGYHDDMHISIGNFTSISRDGAFEMGINLDHDYRRVTTYGLSHLFEDFSLEKNKKSDIEIGSDVWIGTNSYIRSGVCIGDGAVVASHSVVVSDVAPFTIVGGNPAREIKKRFSETVADRLSEIKWWNWPLEKIKEYRDLLDDPERFVVECPENEQL